MVELARSLYVSKGNVTGPVASLVSAGLAASARDERDRRAQRISLTRDGETRLRAMISCQEQLVGALFAGLTRQEIETLSGITAKMYRSLEAGRADLAGRSAAAATPCGFGHC